MFAVVFRLDVNLYAPSAVDALTAIDDEVARAAAFERISECTSFSRHVNLPFPPTTGTVIQLDDWESGPIRSVRYHAGNETFYCECGSVWPELTDDRQARYAQMVEGAKAAGWQLDDPE